MGYTIHHAIIVTSWDDQAILAAHDKAVEIFPDDQVTSVTDAAMNGYRSFLVGPDGSKEGWEESEEGNENREEYIEWLDSQKYDDGSSLLDWVELSFGCEYGGKPELLSWSRDEP